MNRIGDLRGSRLDLEGASGTAMTTSIKEVARRAGVSIGTVSNVLNRPGAVAPTTRQRVLDVITEVGYVRNDSARQLRAGRSRTIAILVLDVANPFFTDVVRGAEVAAAERGAMVVVCNSGEDALRERRHLTLLEEQRVQGVLITPVDGGLDADVSDHGAVAGLVHRGTPVVLVDRGAGQRNLCSVAVDDVLGGRLAGAHLIGLGHRRIGFVGGPFQIPQVADRHAGLLAALTENSQPGGARNADEPDAHVTAAHVTDAHVTDAQVTVLTMPSLSVAAGRTAGERLAAWDGPDRPTAVFCANDLLALGVLQALTRHRVRVPDDIAIVGYDDIDFAAAAAVPLSSVRQPREQLGRTAAGLLLEEIHEPATHRHRHLLFQPELVIRESSAGMTGSTGPTGPTGAAGVTGGG